MVLAVVLSGSVNEVEDDGDWWLEGLWSSLRLVWLHGWLSSTWAVLAEGNG